MVVGSSPASATEWDDVRYVVGLTNDVRAWNGLAPLQSDVYLAGVAADWASHLAWNGYLAHNPDLPYQVEGWWVLGENVGRGWSVEAIHQAWLNSWYHYLNVVEPRYTHIGVGVSYGEDGRVYIVQVFAQF
jgi:uncharacterized protein YkwD